MTKITSAYFKLLKDAQIAQIATCIFDQPWVASVYFVADDDLNIYWLSEKHRRHSREIANNSKTAIAIAIKTDIPVIGFQASGNTTEVSDIATVAKIMPKYIAKYSTGKKFVELFKQGTAKHRLYKFTPKYAQLFDEQNYKPADNPIVII